MRRIRTPTILQMEAVECGAAALAIVLAHFGKYVSLEELRIRCGVSRDGSNAYNLIEAAKTYNLEAQGFKAEIDDLYDMPLPCIVFWNFNHFLVVEGFGKNCVYINDPANGPRKVTYEEFDESFTGVVITLQPEESFKASGAPEKLGAMLKERLKNVKVPIFYVGLAGLALVIPGLAVPTITQLFYDEVINRGRLDWSLGISLSLFFAAFLVGALTWGQQRALNRLSAKLSISFNASFLWHILRLPISFYAQRFSGEIAHRITLNSLVVMILTGNLATTFISILLVFFYICMMVAYSASIASVGLLTALINLGLLWMINRSRNDAYARMQQEFGKSIGFSIGALQSIESIKAAGNEYDVFSKWAGYYTKRLNAEREINIKDVILTTFPILFQGLSTAALLGIGAHEVLHGRLTVGMLLGVQGLMSAFLMPVTQMVNLGSSLQTMKINITRLDDVLKNKIDPVLTNAPKEKEEGATRLQGYLELRNVTFGYSPLDPPLIEKLSLSLNPGQRVALVGPSGCGKSTIAKLVCGLYEPWEGEILYDGKKIDKIPRYLFQSSFGAVDQKIFLFAGSIKENLTLWDATVETADIVQATKDACIHDEILARPHSYETQLIEEGVNFSGGERQRLEIARALINKPRILVMDEATSALDSKTEEIISKNIRRRGCTCIMIAHRLSTIQECDEIIVLDRGKVVQRGSHEELKNACGVYKDLVARETIWNQ